MSHHEYNTRIDQLLHTRKRSLRTLPKALLMGPTGARLWADYLDPVPGFSGSIDFIHKLNIPWIFKVRDCVTDSYEPCTVDWYPSYLTFQYHQEPVVLNEEKFITWEDCAVSCQKWSNNGHKPLSLQLDLNDQIICPKDGNVWSGQVANTGHDFMVNIVIQSSIPELIHGITLDPGDTIEIIVAAAFGVDGLDSTELLANRAQHFTGHGMSIAEIVQNQQLEYRKWFDSAPSFESSDPLLDKTWLYRWFILRHNLTNPALGRLRHPLFYEGRSHKMSKTPYTPKGWEFTKMIPLSVPMQLIEARWHQDRKSCIGAMKNMLASQDQNGLYHCLYVDRELVSYANFFGWAVYQYYLVTGDKETIMTMLPSLKKQIAGWRKTLGCETDSLLIDRIHQLTGKEYQPSYWYFSGFPKDCRDSSMITPLKRVDRAVYYYLNILGVSKLCGILGDSEESLFLDLSEQVKKDILDEMWDENTNFFYDLHHATNEKALVKNIVGFYPYWAEITGEDQKDALAYLFANAFNTPCPFPSVSSDSPVFQPEGGWQGVFIKGRNGCVWDGPTWPYTNSVVLDALAIQSKIQGHAYDEEFGRIFKEFSLLHYTKRDLDQPYLVEHYNSMTGEPLSDEVDYFHSYYIDLVIRHIVGINITEDSLVLDPIDIGLDYFVLDNIEIAGKKIRITYSRDEYTGKDKGIPAGYRLYVNEVELLRETQLTKGSVPLK